MSVFVFLFYFISLLFNSSCISSKAVKGDIQAQDSKKNLRANYPTLETQKGKEAILSHKWTLLSKVNSVDQQSPTNQKVDNVFRPFVTEVAEQANKVVAELASALERDHSGNSTMGNFVADAMLVQTTSETGLKLDMCFTNMGGLRINLEKGLITYGQVMELMPFDNTIVAFQLTGLQVKQLTMHLCERGDAFSGLKVVKSSKNDRCYNEEKLQIAEILVQEDKKYWVCTNNYIFEGGGGYNFDNVKNPVYTGILLRDEIEKSFTSYYLKKRTISHHSDDRVTFE